MKSVNGMIVHHHLYNQSSRATATTPWVIRCPATSPTSPTPYNHKCRPVSGVRVNSWLKASTFIHLWAMLATQAALISSITAQPWISFVRWKGQWTFSA